MTRKNVVRVAGGLLLAGVVAAGAKAFAAHMLAVVGPASGLQPDGRQLRPVGSRVGLGNLPLGGAVTPNGRYLWVATGGVGANEIDIVSVDVPKKCYTDPRGAACGRDSHRHLDVVHRIAMPGLTGGVAFSPDGTRAYVSGIRAAPTDAGERSAPGAQGDVIHVFGTDPRTGATAELRTIPVPSPPDAPATPDFRATPKQRSWPEQLAVTPDGAKLLVALNLAAAAAIVDVQTGAVTYVRTGNYPYGAAVGEGGRIGLVSNEADGTVTAIDLAAGTVIKQITVGAPLSHPEGVAVDTLRHRAYVAVTGADNVVAIDLRTLSVTSSVLVRRAAGIGAGPVDVALAGDQLLVADSGEDAIAVLDIASTTKGSALRLAGRIPVAAYPIAAYSVARGSTLVWVSAKGKGVGPNTHGEYIGAHIDGEAGVLRSPSATRLRRFSVMATQELTPLGGAAVPSNTPIRAGGPIKHVFYVVKENRTYDQVLGDDPRGNGESSLALFGGAVTPNLHALVRRFPLLDNVFADSAASTEGHSWTSAGDVSDYTSRNYPANYAGRDRPYDFGLYAISWPSTHFIFDQAAANGVSYFNYGEAYAGTLPVADPTRPASLDGAFEQRLAHADLGPPYGGCYPSVLVVGGINFLYKSTQVWDSSPPPGAAATTESRFDCFKNHFEQQLAAGAVPALNYLVLPDNHTAGTTPGARSPRAMVAENDLALGQLVDLISHSSIWNSSLILVLEDDSQSGSDHVDAHRIPALVISPYTRVGAVVHDRYDQLSFLKTMEVVLGVHPLGLFDAYATPLYGAMSSAPENATPFSALAPGVNLLERNTALSPDAKLSASLQLTLPDQVPQQVLDRILWHSVHGSRSVPPPPGPGAVLVGDSDG